jgi:hypothetical protein
MYYGNSSSTSSSSAASTFVVSDDFEDNNLTEYSGSNKSLFTTGTTPVFGGSYSLIASNVNGRTNGGGMFNTGVTVAQGQVIRYRQYVDITAGSDNEACTLFGVQTPGSNNDNYAVCLELFGTDRIALSRDVTDNDTSGTVLSSKNVTYTTGWYEVNIDWQTNNRIDVYLFNPSGTLVATTTATDSNYTSGGIGYSYWFQDGAWDSFMATNRGPINPTVFFGAEQTDGGASWRSAQNVFGGGIPDETMRLRIGIENSGLAVTAQEFILEYAGKDVAPSCGAVADTDYIPVPNQASCGSSPVCMQTSTFVTDNQVTTDLLFGTSGQFTSGRLVESPSNKTSALNISQRFYTEVEYVIAPTVNASDTYCLRVTNNGAELDFYENIAELSLQFDPVLGAVTLNGGANISLLPGTTTAVFATGTVTDFNGYADIVQATTTFYRSGVAGGAACTPDNNNCYVASGSQCAFTNCSGDSCVLECRADIFFHADATDSGSLFDGQEWFAFTEVEDSAGGYDFASSIGVLLNTMRAIEVSGAIDYGVLAVNADTGAINASTTITNLGNVLVDIEVQGTDLTDGNTSFIPATQQKFATSTFTYSACGATCNLLSSSTPVLLDLLLPKPNVGNPPVSDEVYWGIAIPFGTNSAPHQGINVFTPVSP